MLIINPDVVTRKFLSLANLSDVQTFYVPEMAEVVMIGEYEHFILKAF